MGLFYRIFQHLLPDSIAWRIRKRSEPWIIGDGHSIGDPGLTIGGVLSGRQIERFFEGLTGLPAHARAYIDSAYLDLFPDTTRELAAWEQQFGLGAAPFDADRRRQLKAAWRATGGQSPRYLQDVLQSAGFAVYIHEWWVPGSSPREARDPREYTTRPTIGTVQCDEPLAQCGEPSALCNDLLANEPGYLVNSNGSPNAPPPLPDDETRWRYFLYWGGETFPNRAQVPAARREEFERLLLKLCPAQHWIVLLVDYVDSGPPSQLDFSDPDNSAFLMFV